MSNIKDVAKKSGVSVTTVSRVLNNKGYISEGTRKKVNEAIKELDYHPNYRAIAFSKQRTNIIGLILPDSSHSFFAEMIKYIELFAFQKNYTIMLCNSLNDKEKERIFINMLKEKRVDGLIMGSHNLDIEEYALINEPIITFERFIDNRIPYVTCDNYTGGMIATNHLIGKGCKNLLYISGSSKLEIYANQRLDAFQSICKHTGINYDYVVMEKLELDYKMVYEFVENKIGGRLAEFDGVFCSNDLMAYVIFNYCLEHNILVPEDMKIIGFDYNSMTRTLQSPRITTIAQPIEQICKALVENMVKLIETNEKITNIQLGVELIEGDTT